MPDESRPLVPAHVWNPVLHRRLASEWLHYLALTYQPRYDRRRVLANLKSALDSVGVLSYAVWETVGSTDHIVKLWLPPGSQLDDLLDAITQKVERPYDARREVFSVQQILRHWSRPPAMTDAEILRQAGSVPPDHFFRLNGDPDVSQAVKADYVQRGILARLRPTPSMKFFLRVLGPPSATPDEEHFLETRLTDILDGASDHGLAQIALLRGSGFAKYLITGRIAPSSWEEITRSIIDPINELGLGYVPNTKTLSHISAFTKEIDRREQLQPSPLVERQYPAVDVEAILHQDESHQLEFKATAFGDLDRSLAAGKRIESRIVKDAVVKAVSGLLNGVGGLLVVGVAEAHRYSIDDLSRIEKRAYSVGRNIVLGVNFEFGDSEWDAYERKLITLIKQHITPTALPWITVSKAQSLSTGNGHHPELALAVVRVREPDDWYWTTMPSKKDQPAHFYVRRGGSTEPIHGRELDEYRRAHPTASRRNR